MPPRYYQFIKKIFLFLSIGLTFAACRKKSVSEINRADFMTPPENSRVYAWWHWMDGNITREGITRDLESMKRQGITGVTILNVGLLDKKFPGIQRVPFASPEWFDRFKWALHEANRLDMTVGAHNCDGWSTSGGPWIAPELSMKEFTWSKTVMHGGNMIDTVLTRPAGNLDYYRDVAVVAFPSVDSVNSFQLAQPEVRFNNSGNRILYDGNPLTRELLRDDNMVDIVFDEPFEAERLAIHLRIPTSWSEVDNISNVVYVKASVDGFNFWTIKGFDLKAVNRTVEISFPETRTRFYRIEIKKSPDLPDYASEGIGELELLKTGETPFYHATLTRHLSKTVSTKCDSLKQIFTIGKEEESAPVIDRNKVLDLTDSVGPDGRLRWHAPPGLWTFIRFGYTTTGATNEPSTPEGRGLECDKMDTAALNVHFKNFPAKLLREAGRYKGNTFKYLFIDSWECGFQNWTGDFATAFEKRRGYSILPWIPVLCGKVVAGAGETEAFLNDYRKTIADLIGERYYGHFAELCHRNGVRLDAEVIYGGPIYPPLDILKTNSTIDVPMSEFWTTRDPKTGLVQYKPVERTDFEKPALAASVYNKAVLAAEAYTGYAHYSEAPWDLKLFGDRAFCSGINRLILHSYVHQPFDMKPGVTLGMFGSHFNRNNSWWHQADDWLTYQARIQYFLQKGSTVADVLFYTGDRQPEFGNYNDFYFLHPGFNALECNFDLLKKLTEKDGRLYLPDGRSFRILVLPDDSVMNLETLYKIGSLVHQGAFLYGPRPLQTISPEDFADQNELLTKEAGKIWGRIDGKNNTRNIYGKGAVFWGITLNEAIQQIGLQPDFESVDNTPENLLFIHKKAGNDDIYFVVNQADESVTSDLLFRVTGKQPEIWDPMYGRALLPGLYYPEGGRMHIPVSFDPRQSLLFIFREQNSSPHIVSVTGNGKKLYPPDSDSRPGICYPEIYYQNDSIVFNPGKNGQYGLTSANGKEYKIDLKDKSVVSLTRMKGRIIFMNHAYMDHPVETEISRLIPWNDFGDPEIRYFSGTAEYSLEFDLPDEVDPTGDSLLLTLGNLRETAHVTLNDSSLGDIWCPGYRMNASGLLRKNGNNLKISVSNVYRNRILGDLIQYGEMKNLWTTSPVDQLLSRYMPLKESGLIGPVEIIPVRPVRLKPE